MKIKNTLLLLSLFIFLSCSNKLPNQIFEYNQEIIKVKRKPDSTIISIIEPYSIIINKYMQDTLCYSKYDLTKGIPESTIGNFVTDLCLNYAKADICIMNKGGLRTDILKGHITREKIYELMPFENELVILEIDKKTFKSLINYIIMREGEPFSGMKIKASNDGEKVYIDNTKNIDEYFKNNNNQPITVLTSDYLANGGDNMHFFKEIQQKKLNLKLRDVIINYCSQVDTIKISLDNRIQIFHE